MSALRELPLRRVALVDRCFVLRVLQFFRSRFDVPREISALSLTKSVQSCILFFLHRSPLTVATPPPCVLVVGMEILVSISIFTFSCISFCFSLVSSFHFLVRFSFSYCLSFRSIGYRLSFRTLVFLPFLVLPFLVKYAGMVFHVFSIWTSKPIT